MSVPAASSDPDPSQVAAAAAGEPASPERWLFLWVTVAALTAGLVFYSQTRAWFGDEGFHLLAAQLITRGERPYLDFIYPQPPLFAYWNAAWMKLCGDNWRIVHLLSALMSGGAILLTAQFVASRFPAGWRVKAGMICAGLIGLQLVVIRFGSIGQAYGVCLFWTVAAFRLALVTRTRPGGLAACGSGLCAGTAAGSSLLAAPAALVLGLWTVWHSPPGRRWTQAAWFATGAAIPFLPLLWLLVQAPRVTVFNVFEYHMFHRASWRRTLRWDLGVVSYWLDSAQGLTLAALAALGLLFLAGRREWSRQIRSEFYLCIWIAAGLAVHMANARPTFHQYFILLVPFLSALGAVGAYAVASRIGPPQRPAGVMILLLVLYCAGLVKAAYHDRFPFIWPEHERVAAIVERVTPPSEPVWGEEFIYFLTRRRPPSGLEHYNASKLRLASDFAARLHHLSLPQIEQLAAAGYFYTIVSCWPDDDWQRAVNAGGRYVHREKAGPCLVFWR